MAQLKSTSIEGNLIVNGTLTANSIKLSNGQTLDNIGKKYWSGEGKSLYCAAGVWTDAPFGITIPKGSYMIVVTGTPQCYDSLVDCIWLGVSNTSRIENRCVHFIPTHSTDYRPTFTHSFFYHYTTTTTINPAVFTHAARTVYNLEVAAIKISD